jgi:2-polyprenyl-3-methyl-5-hydroxy-6-metoxy-1,4-benzoquinol methylase
VKKEIIMLEKNEPDLQAELYNSCWTSALAAGREDMGDLEASLQFLEKIDVARESKILEIGCGIGKLCHALDKKGFKDVTGIDVSEIAIQYGKNKYPHLNLSGYNGTKLNVADESIDFCISFDVIEHIFDVQGHLREVIRVLKPGGRFLFQTPNILSNAIVETIRRRGRLTWRKYHPSLQFSFSLKRELIRAGFVDIEFVKISPLTDFKLSELPSPARAFLKMIPWKRLPVFLQTNFFVSVSKQVQNQP